MSLFSFQFVTEFDQKWLFCSLCVKIQCWDCYRVLHRFSENSIKFAQFESSICLFFQKKIQINMGDEMDECACFWSHEFAMRRLLALVSLRNSIGFTSDMLNDELSFVIFPFSWDKDKLIVQILNALIVSWIKSFPFRICLSHSFN